jgi:hypothetical protein
MRVLYNNIVDQDDVVITGTTENLNYPLTNIQDTRLTRKYRSTSELEQRIIFHKDNFNADYLAILGHNINEPDESIIFESKTAAEANAWGKIAYGKGIYIAIAIDGTNRIMRSIDDGDTWSAIAAPENNYWYGIIFDGTYFIVISPDGTNRVMRSEDGLSWSMHAAAEANNWGGIASGNNVIVAVAATGTNRVMRSITHGETWTAVKASSAHNWIAIAYGNNVFIAVSGDGHIMRSTDYGLSWSDVSSPAANTWQSIIFGNNVFIVVSSSGTYRIMRSIDNGETWTLSDTLITQLLDCIAYGGGYFVAISGTSSGNRYYYSSDNGITWNSALSPEGNMFSGIAYGNYMFIAVAATGTNRVMRSLVSLIEVYLQGNNTDSWSSPSFSEQITDLSDLIIFNFDSAQYNYWSIYINNPGNPDGYIELSHIFIGQYLQMPGMKIDQVIPDYTTSKNGMSLQRQVYGSPGTKYRGFEVNYPAITDEEREAVRAWFRICENYKPFILLPWANNLDAELPIYAIVEDNVLKWKRTGDVEYPWSLSIKFGEVF